MLLTSRGVSYHSSHAYNAWAQWSQCLWTFFHLQRCNNIVIFEILDQRQRMDEFGQSRELDQRYTCPKSIHSPISIHQSTTSEARYSRHNTTSHRQSTCIRSCSGSSSASLVSGYEFLLGLILGSEYAYISMVKRDG